MGGLIYASKNASIVFWALNTPAMRFDIFSEMPCAHTLKGSFTKGMFTQCSQIALFFFYRNYCGKTAITSTVWIYPNWWHIHMTYCSKRNNVALCCSTAWPIRRGLGRDCGIAETWWHKNTYNLVSIGKHWGCIVMLPFYHGSWRRVALS